MRRALSLHLPLLLALLFVASVSFREVSDTDTGWHLAVGRLVGTTGIPFTNSLAWTSGHKPFYPTSWLYDWLGASATTHFGVGGLQALTFLLAGLTITWLAMICHRLDLVRGVWLVPIVAVLIRERITPRPHLASWVVLVAVAWLCLSTATSKRTRLHRLACLPLIALGSNLHSGVAFPAVVLAVFCVEAYVRDGRDWRDLAIAAGGMLALLANPGGLYNLRYLLDHLHVRDVIDIAEMTPPKPATSLEFFVALPIGLVAAWRIRRASPALLGTTALFALLALRAVRFTTDFEIVAAVAVAAALAPIRSPWVFVASIAAGAVAFASAVPFVRAVPLRPRFDERRLPVRAADFIRVNPISGRMFNAFRDGGFLEWALPEQRWFQDARIQAYPPELFLREQQDEASPDRWETWMKELDVEWAVASRFPEHMAGYKVFDSPQWALVYWDDTSEVLLRRDVPRFAPLVSALEYRLFRPGGPVAVSTAGPSELTAWDGELNRFEETSPQSGLAFVIHCAVRKRMGSDPRGMCGRAESLADTPQLRSSLAQVRALHP